MFLASAGAPILKIPKPGRPRLIPRRIEDMPLIYRARTLDRYSQEGDGSITDVYGVANVWGDANHNYVPMNNVLIENDPGHPQVRWYAPKVGVAEAGFHFTGTDKYGIGIELYTGENMKQILVGDPGYSVVKIKDGTDNTVRWEWGSAPFFWCNCYVTEKGYKAVYRQRDGEAATFRYTLSGLYGTGAGDHWEVRRQSNDEVAFTVPKPQYLENVDGEWLPSGPVPFTKERIGDGAQGQHRWELTIGAPTGNKIWS